MEKFSWLWLSALVTGISGEDLLDLTSEHLVHGTWKAPVTLPCRYQPRAEFRQVNVVWKASQDGHAAATVFHWDLSSGDQIFTTAFRGRLSIPKQRPGDVSLQIKELAMTDSRTYTCEVTWEALNKSRITKERTTTLQVVKVPVSKPHTQPRSKEVILVPRGARTSLNCLATGSPPITYRWYREMPRGHPVDVGTGAVLTFDPLQVSDAGRYYCEVENRVRTQREQSDVVQLKVDEESLPLSTQPTSIKFKTRTTAGRGVATTEWALKERLTAAPRIPRRGTTQRAPALASSTTEAQGFRSGREGPRQAGLPLYVLILIAVLCAGLLLLVLSVVFCRRRSKEDRTYEVAYNNHTVEVTPGAGDQNPCEGTYEDPGPRAENKYTMEPTKATDYVVMKAHNEYELLVNKMESEYEIAAPQ